MFTKAIVKKPSKNLVNGIPAANLGVVDFEKAKAQHQKYVIALEECGLKVLTLDADENFPDSTFIEDVALCTPDCAIITNPGANSRKGEEIEVDAELQKFYNNIEYIKNPGTVEAGDIMMVGDHFYIGISARTNEAGARQMITILERYGKTGSLVSLNEMLHLKTGLSYLENNNLLVTGEFIVNPLFEIYNRIEVPSEEAYAANSVWINDFVLVPAGYPFTKSKIERSGYKVLEVDVSEFRKLDGGLSCLSLRF